MLSIGVASTKETGIERFVTFSGEVDVLMQFVYLDRTAPGRDLDALAEISEQMADAIEDCVLSVLGDPAAVYPDVTYVRAFESTRGPSRPLADGVIKPILIQLTFGVTL